MTEQPDPGHLRPEGVSDDAVDAAGKMSEALESVERARGHLYSFHQMIGKADFELDEVLEKLHACGERELAEQIRTELLGRNVVPGRWTFQLVEEFDTTYWEVFRAHERAVREALVGGRRHVYESELKERRRTHGRPGHESRPG
jgi:DNA-binding FrmR family transcriptional regulator